MRFLPILLILLTLSIAERVCPLEVCFPPMTVNYIDENDVKATYDQANLIKLPPDIQYYAKTYYNMFGSFANPHQENRCYCLAPKHHYL